ncbi:HAD family hydrolase [Cohnella hashimotonis]|uniref:HAD-IA family hydrolase n=1 Tax=Cohnella hashimotonis TaxID=2826895 RepID=A0ABT6TTY7_9BACL|nr:HAD-IA family hydrolase [Cohnella hashimotonis]MDI4650321.1 HAD-IA family hydrolase [Cohnella hashimotonis]
MIKAIIFDLDDTLIPERQYIESGYKYIANIISFKLGKNSFELYHLLIELFEENSQKVFNRLFEKLEVTYSQEEIDNLVIEYRNHMPCIDFFEDVIPCIKLIKSKHIKLGIITDGFTRAQHQKLNVTKADEIFDEIIVTDDLGREYWKPHPRAFEIMKERLNVEFEEMIYVGDNPEKDFYIRKIYPIQTIRINRGGHYSLKDYKLGIKENLLISSLLELENIVKYGMFPYQLRCNSRT